MDKTKTSGVFIVRNNKNSLTYIGYSKTLKYPNIALSALLSHPNKKIKDMIKENPDIQFKIEVLEYTDKNKSEEYRRKLDTVKNGLNVFYSQEEERKAFSRVWESFYNQD